MSASEQKYTYNASLVRVVDGDTVVLDLKMDYLLEADFGFYIKDKIVFSKTSVQTFRLFGVDTPEVVGAEKNLGLLAKQALQEMLEKASSIKVVSHGKDKYGRWLGTLLIESKNESGEVITVNVNEWLVAGGFAQPYMG
jgi:endonuclease YncB( thermonuclease family)